MSEPILKVENMNKKFGSTVALNDVSLSVYPGEIRGLIGENGSGKSTVTSIVAGMQPCDSGKMFFKGQEWKPQSMIDALHRGIGMIVQESGTIQGVTVAENIFLAETEKYKNKFGLVNRKKMNADATEVMKNIGVNDVTGDMQMQQLDFQTRKLVEIAKVVMKQPQILVIDETSTALSHDGRQVLYDIMNRFRKENKSVIFISHDLDEIMDVCDTLTVLRDGKIIRTFVKEEFEAGAIRASMIGRELQGDYYRSDFKATSQPQVALDVKNLIYGDRLKDISFQVKNEEHVKWAKNSADKAVTLVKDTAGILPLSPRKTKKVLLEIMGDFPSNERVLESFRTKLSDEGFEVTVYEHENFETARFDVETFKKSYDLVIYIGNVENASNKVTNRLSWYTFWGNGNNVPWFVAERPVVFISLANPYHLVDVPMIKTYINGYSNSEYVIESVMDKLMGRSSFTGKSPVNPFCGKEYLKW